MSHVHAPGMAALAACILDFSGQLISCRLFCAMVMEHKSWRQLLQEPHSLFHSCNVFSRSSTPQRVSMHTRLPRNPCSDYSVFAQMLPKTYDDLYVHSLSWHLRCWSGKQMPRAWLPTNIISKHGWHCTTLARMGLLACCMCMLQRISEQVCMQPESVWFWAV